jgi:hypothetical protein
MSGDEGGSFLPPPEFPPASDQGAGTPPPSIITEPKRSFLRRRIAGVPVWAWIIIDLLIVFVVIAVVANGGDDGDQVETVEATTEPAPSSERANTATSEAPAASDASTTAVQTTVPTTTELPTTIASATTAAPSTPAVAATTTPPPASTTPPTTPPPLPGFAEGIHLVGSEIQPGRYIASGFGFCYWERLSGLSGENDDIVANDIPGERAIVAVLESDVAFNSYDCGRWTIYLPTVMVASFGSGDWVVGQDIAPGRYAANGTGGNCYWERASGFTHSADEVITNDLQSGRAIVEIEPSDVRFTSRECGTWTPL